MRIAILGALLAMGCAMGSPGVRAQAYPNRPITMISGSAAGTYTDVACRAMIRLLEMRLKQPVVLDNRSGAGGYIGADMTARAAPDGYTLLCSPDTTLFSDLFNKDQRPLLKDLALIGAFAATPTLMLAPSGMKVKNLKEFVAAVRSMPGKFNAGFIVNTALMFETITFLQGQKLEMAQVPYVNMLQGTRAVVSNDIQLMLVPLLTAKPLLDAGSAVALATTGGQRFSLIPEVPTAKEQGVNLDLSTYLIVLGPARLPEEILSQLRTELQKSMGSTEGLAALKNLGAEAVTLSTAEVQSRLVESRSRYAEINETLKKSEKK